MGKVLVAGPKCRIIRRRRRVVRRPSPRGLRGRLVRRRAGRRGGGREPVCRGRVWVLLLLLLLLLAGLLLLLLLPLLLLLLLLLRGARSGEGMLVHGLVLVVVVVVVLLLRGCELSAIVEVGSSVVVLCPSKRCRFHSNGNEYLAHEMIYVGLCCRCRGRGGGGEDGVNGASGARWQRGDGMRDADGGYRKRVGLEGLLAGRGQRFLMGKRTGLVRT